MMKNAVHRTKQQLFGHWFRSIRSTNTIQMTRTGFQCPAGRWAEQIETVQYLLRTFIAMSTQHRMLPMAVETGNIALVKLLLEHGAAVDEKIKNKECIIVEFTRHERLHYYHSQGRCVYSKEGAELYMDLVKF